MGWLVPVESDGGGVGVAIGAAVGGSAGSVGIDG